MKNIFKYTLALLMLSNFVANAQKVRLLFKISSMNYHAPIFLEVDLDNTTVGQTKKMLAEEMGIAPERLIITLEQKFPSNDSLWAPLEPQKYNIRVAIKSEEAPEALGTQVSNEVADRARTNTNREFKADNRVVIKHRGQNLLAKVLPANSVDPDVQELVINGILIPVQIGPDTSDIRTVSPDEIVGKLS